MPLPPTEVEEPYRLSQLGTQPLLVPVQVTNLCWHAVCSRSLRWEWVVVEAHQQRLKNPIDYPSWVPNLCWYHHYPPLYHQQVPVGYPTSVGTSSGHYPPLLACGMQ